MEFTLENHVAKGAYGHRVLAKVFLDIRSGPNDSLYRLVNCCTNLVFMYIYIYRDIIFLK